LGTLSTREQKIIRDRHLQFDGGVTLEDLGNELGVSKERVRQLEARAMEKLKDSLATKISTPDDLFGNSQYF
jgi:RNA polymerase sigma-32 factor